MKRKLDLLKYIVRSDSIAAAMLTAYARLKGGQISIRKIGDGCWELRDGQSVIDIFTPYRMLNYRNGINARLASLAKSYGYEQFFAVKEGDVVIDIGANIGEFSIFCAQLGAIVYAFEPDGSVNGLLERNIENFNLAIANISLAKMAVSDEAGVREFYLKPMEADSTLIVPKDMGAYTKTSIQGVRLDEFILSRNIARVDLVKCDAEGAEPEVVASCERVLSRIRKFAIDCGPERNGSCTFKDVMSFLSGHGFKILNEPMQTSRGLVVAENLRLSEKSS